VLAIKGCVSNERDGSPGPAVDDLRELGRLNVANIKSAQQAYSSVLQSAGALPHDATSARMVRETQTGTGRQGYQADISADRSALGTQTAPKDSDEDGLPDNWERTHQLDPNNAADSSKLSRSGYSWLETYCHERAKALITASKR